MTTDEKIEEVLKIARETREMTIEERALNNSRFTQLATGLSDVRQEVRDVKLEVNKMDDRLNAKIDKVYESLSQDVQVFAEDLHHVERRVTRLEKKLLS